MRFPNLPPTTTRLLAGIWLAAGFAGLVSGQNAEPRSPVDVSSPRATLESFIRTCEDAYTLAKTGKGKEDHSELSRRADELIYCLDLSQVPEYVQRSTGAEAAVCIKEILDRIDLPKMDDVPGSKLLTIETETDPLDGWRIPGTDLSIKRVTEGSRTGDYLFSPDSLTKAVSQYEYIRDQPYTSPNPSRDFYAWYLTSPGPRMGLIIDAFPDVFRTRLIGPHALWQWIALALALVLALTALILAYYFGRRMALRFRETNLVRYALSLLFPIAAMLVPLAFNHVIREEIRIAGTALAFFTFSANVILLLTVMIVINALGSRIAEFIISNPKIPNKGLDAQLIRIISRVLSLVLAVIVFLEGGKHLGIPLTTLLASAGVGGLALALAAQDSLKNFFGSIMIILDKPYRVGERILVKGYDGIVEEIGLRSTRLRLLTGHQATIPNEEMARSDIENIGRRPHIRRLVDLRLPIDTPPDKAEKAVEIIREILENHEGMVPEFPPRAYFTEINPDSLTLRFIYWFHPPVMWDFLEFSQGVNLRIQREFAEAGIRLESLMKLLDVTGSVRSGESADDASRPTGGTP